MGMNIVLLGPPGAGKGTQADAMVERYSLEHLSTGDIFRAAYRKSDPLGIKAHEAVTRGELVDDATVIALVERRLADVGTEKGVLFDGFPRTRDQAVALDTLLDRIGQNLTAVVLILVDREDLVERLKDRRLCRGCGRSYHLRFKPPRVLERCDACGEELYQRRDDQPETIRKRFEVYKKDTEPLASYYRNKGLLVTVDGGKSMEEVTESIVLAVDGLLPERT